MQYLLLDKHYENLVFVGALYSVIKYLQICDKLIN